MIDLRSDTVTSPSPEMREAIYTAKVGDHGYGDDKTTIELEAYCADLFGKESALLMTSGTMSDQIAIRCYTQPGDEIVLDRSYHINYFQAGPSTDLGKVLLNLCDAEGGILTPEDIEEAITGKYRGELFNRATLLCLENTINGYGGRIFPLENLKKIFTYAGMKGLPVHMDGERFLNACIATKISPREYAKYTDSISTSFSKGLGAPFGSILMGSRSLIQKAAKYRKWYGGALHQSGFMAAAAMYAIQNNVQRLEVDHRNARLLAVLLGAEDYFDIDLQVVETNMVMLSTKKLNLESSHFVDLCRNEGVLLYPWSQYTVRAVSHLDVSEKDIAVAAEKIIQVSKNILNGTIP
ncbi:MAG: hypothetical protein A2103_01020 [Gammaproteobacteria bacterium GWF2_41_13]|nr:MAG: hypothetical protein A2103_01020 [Gammaproteobacteria bacterium GWF2_41_13]